MMFLDSCWPSPPSSILDSDPCQIQVSPCRCYIPEERDLTLIWFIFHRMSFQFGCCVCVVDQILGCKCEIESFLCTSTVSADYRLIRWDLTRKSRLGPRSNWSNRSMLFNNWFGTFPYIVATLRPRQLEPILWVRSGIHAYVSHLMTLKASHLTI